MCRVAAANNGSAFHIDLDGAAGPLDGANQAVFDIAEAITKDRVQAYYQQLVSVSEGAVARRICQSGRYYWLFTRCLRIVFRTMPSVECCAVGALHAPDTLRICARWVQWRSEAHRDEVTALVAAAWASSALTIGEQIANADQLTLAVQSGVDFVQRDFIDEPRHEISNSASSGGIST